MSDMRFVAYSCNSLSYSPPYLPQAGFAPATSGTASQCHRPQEFNSLLKKYTHIFLFSDFNLFHKLILDNLNSDIPEFRRPRHSDYCRITKLGVPGIQGWYWDQRTVCICFLILETSVLKFICSVYILKMVLSLLIFLNRFQCL